MRHCGVSGAKAAATPSTPTASVDGLLRARGGVVAAHHHLEGRHDTGRHSAVLESLQGLVGRTTAGQRVGVSHADLDAEDGDDQRSEDPAGQRRRDPTPPDHKAGPCGPRPGGPALVAQPRPVDFRADAPEQRGQQRQADQRAHQGDQQAAEAHAAQQRDGDGDEGEEADRHRAGAGHDGVPGCLHGHHDRVVVVPPVRALLAPSGDDEQRVVDRDAEADERDEELHDEAHVGDVGRGEDDAERREDRDPCHDERDHREERGEDEGEDDHRAEGAEERLDEQARGLGVVGALGEQVVAADLPVETGLLARVLEDRTDRDVDALLVEGQEGRRVDERVGRAPVVGEEHVVLCLREVDHSHVGHVGLDAVEHRVDLRLVLLHRLALGHRDDRQVGRVGPTVAVVLEQLLLGLVAGLAGQREVDREPVGGLSCRPAADDEGEEPEHHDQFAVSQDELGESRHQPAPTASRI